MRKSYLTIGLWVILIILFVAFYQVFSSPRGPVQKATWQTVQSAAEDGTIRSVTVRLENGRGVGEVAARLQQASQRVAFCDEVTKLRGIAPFEAGDC